MPIENVGSTIFRQTSFLRPAIDGVGRLFTPLNAPLFTKAGVVELALRVQWIVGVIFLALMVLAVKNRSLFRPVPVPAGDSSILPGSVTPRPPEEPSLESAPQTHAIFSLSQSRNLEATIGADLHNLNRHFEFLLAKLPGHGPKSVENFEPLGIQFAAHMRSFEKQYQTLRRNEHYATYFGALAHLKKHFSFLVDIVHGIIRVPGDGNCLFHSLGEVFRALNQDVDLSGIWNHRFADHLCLRDQVVQWMKRNLDNNKELRVEIDGAINKYIATKKEFDIPELENTCRRLETEDNTVAAKEKLRQLQSLQEDLGLLQNQERKYDLYFNKIDKPGFFASDAEIYAVSQMFGVNIVVEKEYEGKIMGGFETVFNETAPLTLTLVHRNGDHFDYRYKRNIR